jgi:hypothetical protein
VPALGSGHGMDRPSDSELLRWYAWHITGCGSILEPEVQGQPQHIPVCMLCMPLSQANFLAQENN